jgi:hypothetical protein
MHEHRDADHPAGVADLEELPAIEVDAYVLLRIVRFEKERQMSLPIVARGDQGNIHHHADQSSNLRDIREREEGSKPAGFKEADGTDLYEVDSLRREFTT